MFTKLSDELFNKWTLSIVFIDTIDSVHLLNSSLDNLVKNLGE